MSKPTSQPPVSDIREPAALWRIWNTTLKLTPGLLLSAGVAWIGLWSSEWIGTSLLGMSRSPISGIMMAIMIGLIVGNLLRLPAWLQPGIRFCLRRILRLGIILLGIRLSIGDVLQLGALGIPLVILCIVGGLLFTGWLGRLLKLSTRLSTLIAVGTSICGASAIVATGPAIEAKEEEITYAVANITVFGILAMFLYPYLAQLLLGGNHTAVGLFLGTSIHETAQVAGAGMMYEQVYLAPRALDVATVAKLVRNLFMVAVIPLMAYSCRRRVAQEGGRCEQVSVGSLIPLFIVGFLLMALLRTIGDSTLQVGGQAFGFLSSSEWEGSIRIIQTWAGNFLAMAMAGVGLGTGLKQLAGLGLRPFYAGFGAAIVVGLLSLLGITLLGLLGLG